MTRPKKDEKPKETAELQISVAEFTRTRDSVVTGLTTLQNAVGDLLKAYLQHTNTVLGGGSPSGLDTLPISNFLGSSSAFGARGTTPEKKAKKPRKEKDPNAPKRPLTAYFLYSGHARPIVKTDLGDEAAPVAVNDEILRRWHAMSADEKRTWSDAYTKNLEQYKQDRAAYDALKGEAADPDLEVPSDDDGLGVPETAIAAAGAEDDEASSASTSSEDESEDEPAPPPKAPSPPKAAGKAPKAGKKKAAAKANGPAVQPAVAAPSSPTPAAKVTPIPPPTTASKAEKRKTAKDDSAEEPKKKKTKKAKAAEEAQQPAVDATPASEKKGKKKRKNEA